MSTPLSTPVRQAKLGIASTKSLPLANEYKKLLGEQYQRLWIKHQQDLDLIDDIRSYVKARLTIERDYTSALSKLGKQHSTYIAKKFTLLSQCEASETHLEESLKHETSQSDVSDSRLQKRLANNGLDEPDKVCTLYKVWSEHINRLQNTAQNRADQFDQLILVVDKLKDIRSHKASIGKKCLDTHLKRIHEDIVVSMVDVEKARKLYYEDESQAKKARENEEKIKKKRSGLLNKFTDLQAKKEKTSAQREANDIQSTQARNDYIMALAAGNAHLQHYYQRELTDFIHLIDDGVLDHCKVFMATLSECDINSLKDSLTHAQYWSKMINLTNSQKTNSIFLDCEQSSCLRNALDLAFEPCNNDPIQIISLEHNADYALQHEIDKWFTWFKKECRNLSQLVHQLEKCQRAFAEGKKSIELNGQTTEDLEPKIIELKQQIRKSEAAKLKAQARLKVIKEGGMQIEEWSSVESEIKADMARAQEELEAKRSKETVKEDSSDDSQKGISLKNNQSSTYMFQSQVEPVQLQISKDSDDTDAAESIHNLASVSRSASNLIQNQQGAMSGYSALADPSAAWQDDYSNAWGGSQANYNVVVTNAYSNNPVSTSNKQDESTSNRYDLLGASKQTSQSNNQNQPATVQSSSPLSAIMDAAQTSNSPYQGMVSEAYKSDYECDYNRNGHVMRSAASSVEPYNLQQNTINTDPFGKQLEAIGSSTLVQGDSYNQFDDGGVNENEETDQTTDAFALLDRRVIALYSFDKTNQDDLALNEGDTLRVIEISDANWIKAKHEQTGEEGYIPTSYVKLIEEGPPETDVNNNQDVVESSDNQESSKLNMNSIDSTSAWNAQEYQQKSEPQEPSHSYCRAIYDYEPETGTCEDDGLPHLALIQNELMRIIDQGEDDGWWLVIKESTGEKGHVPSMLVEEIDDDADPNELDEEVSQFSDDNEMDDSVKAMPTFEPPVLKEEEEEEENEVETKAKTSSQFNAVISDTKEQDDKVTTSSLIPTSFIIIEPTPEVESRRIETSIENEDGSEKSMEQTEHQVDRDVVRSTTSKPPPDVSYSVVNEDFVLEGPSRKPHHYSDQIRHHETPTILEENSADCVTEAQNNDLSCKTPDGNYEPLSEVDSLELQGAPTVDIVIDSFEDDKQNKSQSDIEDEKDMSNEDDSYHSPVYVQKEIKHTGNIDVSPILRHRAEEFSKQIIAEALMLAPGANVGPSTSSAHPI